MSVSSLIPERNPTTPLEQKLNQLTLPTMIGAEGGVLPIPL
jgi:hypothetical protein